MTDDTPSASAADHPEETGDAAHREPSRETGDPKADRDARDQPAANQGDDNSGQLVQDAVIYGGVHYYGAAESFTFDAESTRLVRAASRVDPQRVAVIRATFVPPEGYPTFAEDFGHSHIGVVTGRPGTGRATTAIHALDSSGLEIHEVTSEASERDWKLGHLPAEPGNAYLLDITALGGGAHTHHTRVREYAHRIRVGGARLVVIAETWQEDPADGYAFLPVVPPSLDTVFLRHLAHFTSRTEAERWIADPEIHQLVRAQTLASTTRMAREIQRVRDSKSEHSDADFSDLVKDVRGIFGNYEKEVRDWFVEHEKVAARAEGRRYEFRPGPYDQTQPERREDLRPDDYLRVLFEAVAVLEGCPSDAVLSQVDELAEQWEVPVQLPSPISGGGLTAMLRNIAADVDADDRIRFNKIGFGDAVLDHLWREFPKARVPLLTWSNDAVRDVPKRERGEVARRWLRLAERQRDPKPVYGLLAAWGGNRRLRSAVVPVVSSAAVHDELGPAVRKYLYQLAANDQGNAELDTAVAQICGQYGKVEPHTALVRLGWLADREDATVTEAVEGALAAIWEEPSCRPVLLRELVAWNSDEKERGRAETARRHLAGLLTRMGDEGLPRLLVETASPSTEIPRALVGDAVAAVLTGARGAGREPVLDTWLAALDRAQSGDVVNALHQVLARSAAAHTAANIRITRRLHEWARLSPSGHTITLAQRVSEADPLVRVSSPVGGGQR